MKQQDAKTYPLAISLKKLRLENFRLFEEVEIDFDPQMTVLIGANGSGKTTILDALEKFLRYTLSTAFDSEKVGNGLAQYEDIRVGTEEYTNEAEADLTYFEIVNEDGKYVWKPVRFKKKESTRRDDLPPDSPGNETALPSNFKVSVSLHKSGKLEDRFYEEEGDYEDMASAKQLGDSFRNLHKDEKYVIPPVILYHRIERSRIQESDEFVLLNTEHSLGIYQNALQVSPSSFSLFEKWFKGRENLERQKRTIDKRLDALRRAMYLAINDDGLDNLADYAEMVFTDYSDDFLQNDILEGVIKINRNGSLVPLRHLSSGERRLVMLVAHIAYRMLVANKWADNPFETNGVVLIDELDAHLHPRWQRKVVGMLRGLFPNVQFVVTTHSPLLLAGIHSQHIRRLENGKTYGVSETYGQTMEVILEDIMGADTSLFKEEIDQVFSLISSNQLESAKRLKEKLEAKIEGKHPDLVKANAIITKKELLAQ